MHASGRPCSSCRAAAPPPPARRRRAIGGCFGVGSRRARLGGAGLRLQRAPVRDDRASPWISSQVSASSSTERWSRPRCARRRGAVEQPRLQRRIWCSRSTSRRGDRQDAQLDAALERIGREARGAPTQAERRAAACRRGSRWSAMSGAAAKRCAVAIERARSIATALGRGGQLRRDLLAAARCSRSCRIASSAWPERRILKNSSTSRAGALRAISWRCASIASRIGCRS